MSNTSISGKPKKFLRFIITLLIVLAALFIGWTAFSLIGRINAASVIPDSADIRLSIRNPTRLL
ncbi:hypothetical protein, partial [Treponema sp. R8-4-B8]